MILGKKLSILILLYIILFIKKSEIIENVTLTLK